MPEPGPSCASSATPFEAAGPVSRHPVRSAASGVAAVQNYQRVRDFDPIPTERCGSVIGAESPPARPLCDAVAAFVTEAGIDMSAAEALRGASEAVQRLVLERSVKVASESFICAGR